MQGVVKQDWRAGHASAALEDDREFMLAAKQDVWR